MQNKGRHVMKGVGGVRR